MMRRLVKAKEFVIDSYNKVESEMDELGFASIKSDAIEISIIFEDNEYECTASSRFLDSFIYVAQSTSESLSIALATITMNLMGHNGEWSLYSIQKAIEEQKEKDLAFSDFCESLGYEN